METCYPPFKREVAGVVRGGGGGQGSGGGGMSSLFSLPKAGCELCLLPQSPKVCLCAC